MNIQRKEKNKKRDPSILGFGGMRLPKSYAESESLVLLAIEKGITYFDTAYIYPNNEKLLGRIFKENNVRDKVEIATKIPHYLIKNPGDLESFFQTQLERLNTDYVDHYLMHMLPDVETWESLNAISWIEEKKAKGQIRNIGFSYHGGTENFIDLIDAYSWDFAQIQYNYMDEHGQAGIKGARHAAEKKVPLVIMEPLRGGLLATSLPKTAVETFKKEDPTRTPAQWGLQWLFSQEIVSCVLSGMNTEAMLLENIRTAESSSIGDFYLSPVFKQVKRIIESSVKVPCTGCSYCMPCPFGVDIPGNFRSYNASYLDGYFRGFREYIMCTSFTKKPTTATQCVKCGACLKHCPQSINIPKELESVKKRFHHPIYGIIHKIIKIKSR